MILREISTLKGNQVAQLYAGYSHSFVITQNGKLWGWGENSNFILGNIKDDNDTTTSTPTKKNKFTAKQIYYKPEELKVNIALVVKIIFKNREYQVK